MTKRLFTAIKIKPSDDFVTLYNNLRIKLKHERIKWVPTGNIHITLKFFGETHEDRIPDISKALRSAAEKHPPFQFELKNVGLFGSTYKPRVIWFGIENSEALKNLAVSVINDLEKAGWERDRQNFVPHLTVARIKSVQDRHLFQHTIDQFKFSTIQTENVKEFYLYESILRKEGPIYNVLENYPLLME